MAIQCTIFMGNEKVQLFLNITICHFHVKSVNINGFAVENQNLSLENNENGSQKGGEASKMNPTG